MKIYFSENIWSSDLISNRNVSRIISKWIDDARQGQVQQTSKVLVKPETIEMEAILSEGINFTAADYEVDDHCGIIIEEHHVDTISEIGDTEGITFIEPHQSDDDDDDDFVEEMEIEWLHK